MACFAVLLIALQLALSGVAQQCSDLSRACATCGGSCNKMGEMPNCALCSQSDFNDNTNCLICKEGCVVRHTSTPMSLH